MTNERFWEIENDVAECKAMGWDFEDSLWANLWHTDDERQLAYEMFNA